MKIFLFRVYYPGSLKRLFVAVAGGLLTLLSYHISLNIDFHLCSLLLFLRGLLLLPIIMIYELSTLQVTIKENADDLNVSNLH